MIKVNVPVQNNHYTIFIDENLYENLSTISVVNKKSCLIVTDSNVSTLYAETVRFFLIKNGATRVEIVIFRAGEESKNLQTFGTLCSVTAQKRFDRKSIIVALGGGVVGDIAGFLSSSFMRGINFIQIPTSLLAMVDSSVGGKVGIDLPEGKNLIGAFHQPLGVFADLSTLRTLPEREIRCGLAEIVKYGMIFDDKFFELLEKNVEKLLNLDLKFYEKVIKKCCEIKAEIVAEDEKENGIRAILNYGHTFGHALEVLGNFSELNHGEAISIGMTMAASFAVNEKILSAKILARQTALLEKLGLPTKYKYVDPEKIYQAMTGDKKNENQKIVLILINKNIGNAIIKKSIEKDKIFEAIQSCFIY